MKITIVGAGKTGRGFIAALLRENELTFIDKNEDLVKRLNFAKEYSVCYFGTDKKETVKNYVAKTWKEVKEIDADLILVSVGGSNLADVGSELKKFIKPSQKIIVCENASKPAQKLYDAIGIDGVKIAESTVFCTTIEKEGLDISSEEYPYLQFDIDAFDGDFKEVKGLKPVSNFGNFLTRKLYTYNAASCVIAYLGALKGYKVYSDAANDKEILSLLDKNYEITNEVMCEHFGYEKEDQKEFALLSKKKFTNTTIADTVARNAREPQRKIAKGERISGIMALQNSYGYDSSVLEKTLAAAVLYDAEDEIEWTKIKATKSYGEILHDIAGLDENSAIYNRVMKYILDKNLILD